VQRHGVCPQALAGARCSSPKPALGHGYEAKKLECLPKTGRLGNDSFSSTGIKLKREKRTILFVFYDPTTESDIFIHALPPEAQI